MALGRWGGGGGTSKGAHDQGRGTKNIEGKANGIINIAINARYVKYT